MTLEAVLAAQAGVLSAAQAHLYIPKASLHRLTRANGRWQRLLPGVIVTHNGHPSRPEKLHAALLYGGQRAAISHATSGELHGMKGYPDVLVHILVPHTQSLPSRAFVLVHRSRNAPDVVGDVHPLKQPRRVRLPRALVEMARSAKSLDDARGPMAAAVQQGLVRPDDVRRVLLRVGPLRHQVQLLAALDDIELGAHSGLELQFLRLIRAYALPLPMLQQRVDAGGLRKLDATWPMYGVWVEIDGAAHRDDSAWQSDLDRHNEINVVAERMRALRFSGHLIRTRSERCARQLVDALMRGGWCGT